MATYKDAKEVAKHLVRTINPIAIILFGSVARENEGADLDILIVIEDSGESVRDLTVLVHKELKPFYKRFPIDPFIVTKIALREFYRKGSPFLRLIQKEGKSLYMKDFVKDWMCQAKEELQTAKYLMEGGFHRAACYHAQQALEKALKAALLQKGWELEKTHSIGRLAALASDYNLKIEISDEETVFVDSIYRGRYPAEEGLLPLGEPDSNDARNAVGISSRTVEKLISNMK